MRAPHLTRSVLAAAACLAACTSEEATAPPADAPGYHTDIAPLLERSCAGCHAEGGIGPFVFSDYASTKALSGLIAASVTSRRMPPWMPDPACRSYTDQRRLSDADVALVAAWHAAGAPEGSAAPAAVRPAANAEPMLPPASLALQAEAPYLPTAERPDDYRCLPLTHTFERDVYLTRSRVVPGARAQVHHVLLYVIGPQFAAQVEAVDTASPGPGYTCFGGPGVGVPETIGAWVPGSVPTAAPDGAAIRIPAGSRLIMQMHYNTANSAPVPDQSQVELWLTETQPQYLMRVKPLAHLGMKVAAGDARSVQSRVYTNRDAAPWRIVGLAGHMHVLGQRIQVRALEADRTSCMLDIPALDFSWQQNYRFLPGEEVTIEPGESVRVDCTFDNSAANQPVVGGVKRTPREVTWGEGTLDEMCLAYVNLIEPWSPAPVVPAGGVCPGFQACYDGCRTGPNGLAIACALSCSGSVGQGRACTQCVFQSAVACTLDVCVGQIDTFLQCLDTCAATPDQRACVESTCVNAIVAYDTCAAERVSAGTCDSYSAACGADL
jgi:mono/diheme cytochrome c family protein